MQTDGKAQGLDPETTVVIVGTAARLPGGVRSAHDLWKYVIEKRSAVCTVPSSRYNIGAFYNPNLPCSVAAEKGYFLDEDVAKFDAAFFDIEEDRACQYDPQLRLLLEVIFECLENAGQVNYRGQPIGCYVGVFGKDWMELLTKDQHVRNPVFVMSTGDFALSNIASYYLDLRGPSMTVETGCSASTTALHNACQALKTGECSTAVVAGSNLILSPTLQMHMGDNAALSPSGTCRSFDAAADGYGRGEGINAILIKTLAQALRDGDNIRAVVRGTSLGSDGQDGRMMTPSIPLQLDLIRDTYRRAGIADLGQTAFMECHGTGTQAGDVAETSAVAMAFPDGLHIGSAKANFGHSEGASGITSIIKCLMAFEHQMLPPTANFETLNPKIPATSDQLKVLTEPAPWPKGRVERMSVNNFGIGGANAHVILDSASLHGIGPKKIPDANTHQHNAHLLVVSAKSPRALERRIHDTIAYLKDNPHRRNDLAHTLGARRVHMPCRAFLPLRGDTPPERDGFKTGNAVSTTGHVFVFTGQGAGWPSMGKGLLCRFPRFAESIECMDSALRALPSPPAWSLQEKLENETDECVTHAELSQPLCCAVQVGIVDLLTSWGIRAGSVIGHSSGEIAAAYAAGVFDAKTAIILAYYRGRSVQSASGGVMAAIGLSRDTISQYLLDGVVVACENSPVNVTISGDKIKVAGVMDKISHAYPDVLCRQLRVDTAYHSHHMDSVSQKYQDAIHQWCSSAFPDSMVPLMSTVHGQWITDPRRFDSAYWKENLRSPVLFSTGVQRILEPDAVTKSFVEIGPHSALSGPIRQIMASHDNAAQSVYVPTLVRDQDAELCLLATAGTLFATGASINLTSINGEGQLLHDVPPYPWDHDKILRRETRVIRQWRLREHPHHELLGSRTLESTDMEPAWRNMLSTSHVPWLEDHCVLGQTLFPGAGYMGMVGEALQQITGCERCNFRLIAFSAPLFLDTRDAELITSMRRSRISQTVETNWWEFSIISIIDGIETKHCTGQVRSLEHASSPMPGKHPKYPRRVSSRPWYKALHNHGLEYAAEVTEDAPCPSRYIVHPVAIDKCLHVLSVAFFKGRTANINMRAIPAVLEGVEMGPGGPRYQVQSQMGERGANMIFGSTVAVCNDQVALSIERAAFAVFDEGLGLEDRGYASQPSWKPHIDLVPSAYLAFPPVIACRRFEILAKIADMYIAETARRVSSSRPPSIHLQKFHQWLMTQWKRISRTTGQITPAHFDTHIKTLKEQLHDDDAHDIDDESKRLILGCLPCMDKVLAHCLEIMEGVHDGLEILMEDGSLEDFYTAIYTEEGSRDFLTLAGHSNPIQRVLEIGGGTGAGTAHYLQHLHSPEGTPLFSTYVFTDISSGFLGPAQEKFSQYDGIEYQVLDITRDPAEQGFDLASYDLVIASNVIHATPCLKDSLVNIRSLLAPGGRLLLQESKPDTPVAGYIVGALPGWWVGEEDDRLDQPNVSVERWERELQRAGFAHPDFVTCHDEMLLVQIVASVPVPEQPSKQQVTFLVSEDQKPKMSDMQQLFESHGYPVKQGSLEDDCQGDVIALLDLDQPFLYDVDEQGFQQLRRFCSRRGDSRTIWVTRSSQLGCQDPRYGLIYGFSRALRVETGVHFLILEVDNADGTFVSSLLKVYEQSMRAVRGDSIRPDLEVSLYNGLLHVERYYKVNVAPVEVGVHKSNGPISVRLANSGLLDSFEVVEHRIPLPGVAEVDVEVKHIGLNFRDVVVALGLLPSPETLGCEGAGVIRTVGPGVTGYQPGDRVAFLLSGGLSSRMIVPSFLLVPVPDRLSLQEAATVLVVYITVIYALEQLGSLNGQKSVLIHSACGGVGLAALKLYQQKYGAKVFVTVGNEEKAQYLMDRFAIPRSHIFNSRDDSFLADLLSQTNHRGVDLVLNSLSGELLHASLKCLAPGGTMLEIGKRDFISNTMIPIGLLSQGRSFVCVDMEYLLLHEPDTVKETIQTIAKYLKDGTIDPITPITSFNATDASQAFKYMQMGNHIGKIVLDMPSGTEVMCKKLARPTTLFSPHRAYLLVGGLGGIGRGVSNWMVEHGARCLIYLSPSAGTTEDHQLFFEELLAQGCQTLAVQGSVSDMNAVQSAIARSPKPLAGVFQLSLFLKDSPVQEMSYDYWKQALDAKVQGTWNLHRALQGFDMDFFILFGSVSGALGLGGQANYGAANTFLAAFAEYRAAQGQPASILDLGLMAEIGYVSRREGLVDAMTNIGCVPLREKDLLVALEKLVDRSKVVEDPRCTGHHLALGLGSNLAQLHLEPRVAALHNSRGHGINSIDSKDDGIKGLMDRVDDDPSVLDLPATEELFIRTLGNLMNPQVARDAGLDINVLSNIAIDSLIAIEARTWVRRKLGVEMAMADINASSNVGGLTKLIIEALKKLYTKK